jgi:YD repeat-containing protein
VLTATDAANTNTQTTTYDGSFNPIQVTDLLNGAGTQVSSSTYDSLGNLLTSTDANGKTMVVCPTSTPATSVIASSGPVGRIPTFSLKSDARGRAPEVVFCETAVVVTNKAATAERIGLVIAPDYICGQQS